jgi:hypothetical protein
MSLRSVRVPQQAVRDAEALERQRQPAGALALLLRKAGELASQQSHGFVESASMCTKLLAVLSDNLYNALGVSSSSDAAETGSLCSSTIPTRARTRHDHKQRKTA